MSAVRLEIVYLKKKAISVIEAQNKRKYLSQYKTTSCGEIKCLEMSRESNDTIQSDTVRSSSKSDYFRIQLNNQDYYMSKPTFLDPSHGESLPLNQFSQVPNIRVFGALPTGHQVLCHVHGILPYMFIKYDGQITDTSTLRHQRCAQVHKTLEVKIRASFKRKKDDKHDLAGDKLGNLNFVADVSVVKGIPFYGYHVGWNLFYKISLLNPSCLSRISELIRDGKIFGKKFEIYESHIPYLLQWTADFNLFGCSWINVDRCYFRSPVLNSILDIDKLTINDDLQLLLDRFCDFKCNVLSRRDFPRVGNGLIEIDILPQFIKNREKLQHRDIHHDFLEKLGDISDIPVKPYVSSARDMINELTMQREELSLKEYKEPPETKRHVSGHQWQSSGEFEAFYKKAQHKTSTFDGQIPNFENFIDKNQKFSAINTPYEALPQLWPRLPQIEINNNSMQDKKNDDQVNASFTEYEIWGVDNENEGVKGSNIKPRSYSWLPESIASPKDSTILLDHQTKYHNTINFSMDCAMTQNMASKRKLRSSVSANKTSLLSRKRKKVMAAGLRYGKRAFVYGEPPFSYQDILNKLEDEGFPKIDYKDPFFSNPVDLENKPYAYAGKRFEISSTHVSTRIPVQFGGETVSVYNKPTFDMFSSWKYALKPPTYDAVQKWYNKVPSMGNKKTESQISMHTPHSKFLYKFASDVSGKQKRKKSSVHDSLTHLTLEIHANTRSDKIPDPAIDEVSMIIWCLEEETFPLDLDIAYEGIMIVHKASEDSTFPTKIQHCINEIPVMFYESEFEMFEALTDLVLLLDPDILSGFEIHNFSWGYIIERCQKIHQFDIVRELARVKCQIKTKLSDTWGYAHSSGIMITGRHMINIWRALRSDVNLTQYTIESAAFNILHKRLPHFSFESLTNMWNAKKSTTELKTVLNYWLSRAQINIQLLRKQDYIARNIEQARLIGIDFHSVYYRGSQFKVESFLIRICKSESFILLSPGKKDVRKQKALECVPLVMEPESAFYKSPLIVLDFQSLYPSIMIGYNYCYSTMIGRVREINLTENNLGVSKFSLPRNILALLKNDVTIAPNGVVYAKTSVRKSTLSKMLTDILDVRVMIKKTMNEIGDDNTSLKRLLNNKQLALKLLANVTYGYTSASFSGRMPCSDLADSIVQTGRETLEKAIDIIEKDETWNAKVVYGDTDSLFVYLPGKTAIEAFSIGHAMAERVTQNNPKPIFLKFEKVYHPSILISKKRYVGFSYESPSQTLPIFDAKGIETVRRDGIPAQQKIIEKCIRLLFQTKDLSKIKKYLQNEFFKIQIGKVSAQDFCFAKEVKLGAYKSEKTAPAGAVVVKRRINEDHRAEPQYKERIPYLVVKGKQGQLLRERCVSPEEFLEGENLELDSEYYINKILIPPLDRLFNLIGINVGNWAQEIVKSKRASTTATKVENITRVGTSATCCNCGEELTKICSLQLCDDCLEKRSTTTLSFLIKKLKRQKEYETLKTVCRTCSYRYTSDAGIENDHIASKCNSYDCPVFYSRVKAERYLRDNQSVQREEALISLNDW
ncbi:CDN_1a_G0053580.mRNA.1.CDS.1 [Saccharomyces cerevisiae]|nr:CCC_1a_G0053550.mRNA.1.CDS.1 [Saccharomyces cerevisiae]CAI4834586.1 BAP_1a_G0053840.mRNA.1.CDS.1 [Saccharomyces cerevisiae]CAI4844319.1 CDN_1a_G0053580.mRNA.1.CDS.1 [Saccharomyces cerevisiae]CAI7372844.1 BAP_1a_G0053840.mRNA.1.CDS.1 [Saccharomyces cerevisiae]CAI7474940.1 CCC_1a_G0053550.mRNA.1.CDS.1 [Saccharomyces cerevisiae]